MSPPLRFSQLSPQRQALIRLCQAINYGSIEYLAGKDSEPVFEPWPVTVRDLKLDKDEDHRPEFDLADFVVRGEVARLLKRLDEMSSGTLRCIEVHAGLPRRVLVEAPVTGACRFGSVKPGGPNDL